MARSTVPAGSPAGNPPAHAPAGTDALDAGRRELATLIDALTQGVEGTVQTVVPGLALHRILHPGRPRHHVQRPALAVIAQGSKRLMVGGEVYAYDPLNYLVSSVDLPVCGMVKVGSPTQPYLGLRLDLDVDDIRDLMRDETLPPAAGAAQARGLYVHRLDGPMLDALLRLLRLLGTPRDIPMLAPLIQREIFYRLLMDGPGDRLRQMALQDSLTQRVTRAVQWLRVNFAEPLRVETLARDAHMSVSSLHHHFKAVTAMSPLQYQKHLRLQQARRLMFSEGTAVSAAAQRVGYESASQFSRDYSRLFGLPPLRDRQRWLDEATAPNSPDVPARPSAPEPAHAAG